MLIALFITYLARTGKLEVIKETLRTVPYLGRWSMIKK